ncbi:MAG: hypothetical protein WBE18_01280 [Gammaproteobacteria bacterium]
MKLLQLTLIVMILSLSNAIVAQPATPISHSNSAEASTTNSPNVIITDSTPLNDDLPWSVLLYRGVTTENTLGQTLGMHYTTGNETVYSLEVARELPPDNVIRRYLQPLMSTTQLAANVAYRDDSAGGIYEFDPYLIFRWDNFPWRRYLDNSIGLGWGVSYVTRIPTWEQRNASNTKRLLNYLMLEVTFALPRYPQWQVALRLHHRSGVFGLYGADNAGSTAVGIGIRYRFSLN